MLRRPFCCRRVVAAAACFRRRRNRRRRRRARAAVRARRRRLRCFRRGRRVVVVVGVDGGAASTLSSSSRRPLVSAAAAFLGADVASYVAVAASDRATALSSLPSSPSRRAPARSPSFRRFHRRRRRVTAPVPSLFGRRRRRKFAAADGIILPMEFPSSGRPRRGLAPQGDGGAPSLPSSSSSRAMGIFGSCSFTQIFKIGSSFFLFSQK